MLNVTIPANLACGMRAMAVLRLSGSLQFFFPMSVITTEGFTEFTRILNTRERNVLFNDTLNTFYLRLYGIRHMVKDHSDSEKGNLLPPHRLLLSINSKGSFICTLP